MIPRRVFHIWLSDKPEGELAQRCVATWDKLGCEIVPITFDNCDMSEPFVRQALFSGTIEGRVKANDFLRIKYLYEQGGIYLDNDVEVLKPLDPFLEHGCFLAAEDNKQVNMAVVGARAGHWFIKECLDAMRTMRGDGPESPVQCSLGTISRVAREYGWKNNTRFDYYDLTIYHSSVFYPTPWTDRVDPENAGYAYTIHHWNHSWNQLVSVIVPCYNYAHFLKECLDSVLAQTYKDIEVIVVDDGSTDDTASVVKQYPTVRYIHQTNKGLSAARNAGIRAARGQFIQPLDADDKLSPDSIASCVELMQQTDIACPGQQEFGGGSRFYPRNDKVMTLQNFLQSNRLHCASMFRKKAWADVGGYDEEMREGYEDWDFWIRLLAKGYKAKVINKPQFFYRIHPHSMLRGMKSKHNDVVAKMRAKYRAMRISEQDAELVVHP